MQGFALEEAHVLASRLEYQRQELIARGNSLEGTILRLSAPVIRLWNEVVVIPLVGVLDARRGEELMNDVATHVMKQKAHYVIVDLTGAEQVDTFTVRAIGNIANVVRLLGARLLVSGLHPEVAQTVVGLGVDMPELECFRAVSDALRSVFAASARARPRAP